MKLRTPDMASPRRARLNLKYGQETVAECVRKIRCLQQDNRRLREKVLTMKELIEHLRSKCPEEYRIPDGVARTLNDDLPETLLQLVIRKKMVAKAKYSKELRKFALTLHFYSPRSYNYVREEFQYLLPHTSTIRNWYARIDGEPGFCQEALSALKAKAKDSPTRIIASFMMDEIDIRSEITYRNGQYHGYEDLGFGYSDSDSIPLAKKAMVFMLVCLNGKWKLPIAYFLVNSLEADNLSRLVETALQLVDDADIVVRSVTFDGLSTNLACFKLLGANLELGPDFRPWFPHPCHKDEKVFLFLDPPHALKLVRNTLGDYVLVDKENRGIKFVDIKELFYLNQTRELYSAPRLTKRHIQWRENKMRVRLAAQTLSSSVAAALLHAKKKGFEKFASCEGTAEYCIQFDHMFDILNCRSVFSKKVAYDVPVSSKNLPKCKAWCDEAMEYIRGLKIVENPPKERAKKKTGGEPDANDGEEIKEDNIEERKFLHWEKRERKMALEHRRKTGFLGFIVSLTNLIPLFLSLQAYGLKYLLPYKLCQDHLETWFSAARSRGGCNNNPNAEQFKSTFKRLLVHHELRTSTGSNCSSDDTKILTVSSTINKRKSGAGSLFTEVVSDDVLDAVRVEDFDGDFDEIGNSDNIVLSKNEEYDADVVAYLAGFLVRKLQDKKMATLEKIMKLKDPTNTSDLIDLKNRGKLTIPAKIIVEMCSEVEKQFRMNEEKLLHPNTRNMEQVEWEILEHLEDCGFTHRLDTHTVTLIMQLYIRLKIRYACKRISTVEKDIRHSSKKQPIFLHQ